MIYVVSGFMRSGTSMIMRALIEGGMDAYFDNETEKRLADRADENYHPNSDGYYEIGPRTLHEIGFPRRFDGKLIKVLFGGLHRFAAHPQGYRIIFMRRPFEEVRQSYEAAFNNKLSYTEEILEQMLDNMVDICKMRRDMEILEMSYPRVLDAPNWAFRKINGFGFPIDVEKAVAVIDPNKQRFRLGDIAIGA